MLTNAKGRCPNSPRLDVRVACLAIATAFFSTAFADDLSDDLSEDRKAAIERKITALPSQRKGEVTLRAVPSHTEVKPGDTVRIAIDFRIRFGWHMYAASPGEGYIPVKIKWSLPNGVTVKNVHWSDVHSDSSEAKPFYKRKARAVATLVIKDASPPIEIKPTVTWQVCKEQCRVGSLAMPVTLAVGSTQETDFAPLLRAATKAAAK